MMDDLFQRPVTEILSVSEFNRRVRACLESAFPSVWVSGEISNFIVAASGHAYFVLKDGAGQVRCVAFRSRLQSVTFHPANGDRVEVRALPTLYETRGDLQLNIETIRRAGQGDLYARFLALKAKLADEKLFAAERKRTIPFLPRRIGIVTSPQAAALSDVVSTLQRRAPYVRIIVYPTRVQGEGAAQEIATAIARAGSRNECDTLILCRGGGSLEDLWAFNEEIVARAIDACPLPLVCGVGHETDFTIADFVADLRAPTPTAAAELAAPAKEGLLDELDTLARRLRREIERNLENRSQLLDYLARRLQHPAQRLQQQRAHLAAARLHLQQSYRRWLAQQQSLVLQLQQRLWRYVPQLSLYRANLARFEQCLCQETMRLLHNRRNALNSLRVAMAHLNPEAVLERGYAIITRDDASVVFDSADLALQEAIQIQLCRGKLRASVTEISSPEAAEKADN